MLISDKILPLIGAFSFIELGISVNSKMKSLRLVSVLVLTFLAVSDMALASELSLSSMIREIQIALRDSQKVIKASQMPALSSVELEMKVVQTDVGGGKISFFIVEVGGSQSTAFTSVVKITLTPPSADASSDVAATDIIGRALKDAVIAAAAAIKVAKRGNPPLDASRLEITLSFAVVSDGSGGFKLVFPPFEASLEGKISQSNIQTMKVTFE